jgi:hypothetical protein
MPRYRFSWGNFSPSLLKKLTAALKLDGKPEDALRKRYGARPKTDFIKDAWPTLSAAWLSADSASRRSVVEKLRAAGLGDKGIRANSRQGQLEYLSSCRNTRQLRDIVLTAFLTAGEPAQMRTRSRSASPETGTRTGATDTHKPKQGEPGADSIANLNEWVVATLKDAYGLSDVYRDQDGDIPLPRGSSVLFIRPHAEDSPFLEIFAPLLAGFELTPDVYEAVNAINAQVPMAKATFFPESKQIILSAQLLADTLSSTELLFSLDLISDAADHFDTMLQKRFGGQTMQEDDAGEFEV